MEEFRFRSQHSPRNEPPMNKLVSPPRNGNRLPQPVPSHDARNSLPRRFTTESSRVPTISQIPASTAPRPPTMPQNQDLNQAQALQKVQLLEKKRLEYERIREQKRRFEMEMQRLDQQEKQEEQELAQMTEDLGRMAGHQSEPTTPPEYREAISAGFPGFLPRPNRYSPSSLTSPPGMVNRPGRSGSQLASPHGGMFPGRFAFDDQLPARSFPATRRNSDDDEKEEAVRQDPTSHRSTNALNRYSMPVTKSRSGLYDMALDGTGTTRFLFGDDEPSGDIKGYGMGTAPDDSFPTLTRREDYPNMLSASSAALDLALSQPPATEDAISNGWGGRQRTQPSASGGSTGLGGRPAHYRHSLNAMETYTAQNLTNRGEGPRVSSPPSTKAMAAPPTLTSSYSSSGIHTATNPANSSLGATANNHASQHLQNHNASLGRIPAGAMASRQSRELPTDPNMSSTGNTYQSMNSSMHCGATGLHSGNPPHVAGGPPTSQGMQYSQQQPFYGGYPQNPNYGMMQLAGGMQGLAVGSNPTAMYSQPYPGYGTAMFGQHQNLPAARDNQARMAPDRRRQEQDSAAQYTSMTMDQVKDNIYAMCRDQHGCRFLQRQLETRNPEYISQIWKEVRNYVVELMVDPFGNYLCQKLLEYCDNDQRSALVTAACQDIRRIALNQHGTRALQKMIEFISTPNQIEDLISALGPHVVDLIQDLNGNHVIQKCLNKLTSSEANFIFQAVGENVIDVGTHRHGCCVLQRCIDHAAGQQKVLLIERITANAPILVMDPFGNYVVQYIIDLNESTFTEPLVHEFQGKIGVLSRHKFSSNVVEKCLRCATDGSKDAIISEMLNNDEVEKMLRDPYANYVVQTALEYATPHMKNKLIEAIRPILSTVRNTPYGRRINAKISAFETKAGPSQGNTASSTPSEPTLAQAALRPPHQRAAQVQGVAANASQMMPVGTVGSGMGGGMNGMNNMTRPSGPMAPGIPQSYGFGPMQAQGFSSGTQSGQFSAPSHAGAPGQQFSQMQTSTNAPGAGGRGNSGVGTPGPIGLVPGNGSQTNDSNFF